MSFGDLFRAIEEAFEPEPEPEEPLPDTRSTYLMRPQKGNLSNWGRERRDMDNSAGKGSGEGDEAAPQVYVRIQIELSYDKPRPDPDGDLRRECGAAIRRAIEAKLTGEALAAQIGDARVTLRAMMMRQEDSLDEFGSGLMVRTETRPEPADPLMSEAVARGKRAAESLAAGETVDEWEAAEARRAAALKEYGPMGQAPELIPDPTLEEARPAVPDTARIRAQDGRFVAVEDDEGTAPNAGSAQ